MIDSLSDLDDPRELAVRSTFGHGVTELTPSAILLPTAVPASTHRDIKCRMSRNNILTEGGVR